MAGRSPGLGVPIEAVTVVPPEPVRVTTVHARLTVDGILVLHLGETLGNLVFSPDQTEQLRQVLLRYQLAKQLEVGLERGGVS